MKTKLSMPPREDGSYTFEEISDLADHRVWQLNHEKLTAEETAIAESDLTIITDLVKALGWSAQTVTDFGVSLRISEDEYLDCLIPENVLENYIRVRFSYTLERYQIEKSILQHLQINMETAKAEYQQFVIDGVRYYSRKDPNLT